MSWPRTGMNSAYSRKAGAERRALHRPRVIFESVRAEFGWGDPGEDAYPLETADVADLTGDEVHLP